MRRGLTRSEFIWMGAAGLALWAARQGSAGSGPGEPGGQKEKPRRIPIGLQLYSVRDGCAKDLPAVLAAVAAMGYEGVEFAGYPGRAATIHLKEHSSSNPAALLGDGDVDWRGLFDVVEAQGATDWFIVEYESDGVPPLTAVERCLAKLRKMGR